MDIWYGKPVSEKIYQDIDVRISHLKRIGIQPGLGLLLVGNDPASEVYVRMKGEACNTHGISSVTLKLPSDVTKERVIEVIQSLNHNHDIHGFIIQLPLPKHLPERELLNFVKPEKDVDCLTTSNVGSLVLGEPKFLPCTPAGIMDLLTFYQVELSGKRILVIGRSNIVGRPISILLSHKGVDATVTIAHSRTVGLTEFISQFDGIVSAIGSPEFLDSSHLKKDAWIVDVGVNRVPADNEKKYRLVGDVRIREDAHLLAYTPVPGGIGPLTIANLLRNCIISAERTIT